jgi:hypothetical protein
VDTLRLGRPVLERKAFTPGKKLRSLDNGAFVTKRNVKLTTSIALGLLLAFVMLMPIGGNSTVVHIPGEPAQVVHYYWSLGSIFLLGPLSGGALEHLGFLTVLVGVILSVGVGYAAYRLASTSERGPAS